MVQILQRILRRAQVGARVGELARERLLLFGWEQRRKFAEFSSRERRDRDFLRANSLGQVKESGGRTRFEEDVGVCRNAIEIPRGLSTLERGRPITAFYRNCFFEFLLRQLLRRYCTAPLYLLPASSACLPDNEARRRHSTSHSSMEGLEEEGSVRFPAERETQHRLKRLVVENNLPPLFANRTERCKNSSPLSSVGQLFQRFFAE